jgi:hypothetical protein
VIGQEHTGSRRKVILISDVRKKLLFETIRHNNPQPDHGAHPIRQFDVVLTP